MCWVGPGDDTLENLICVTYLLPLLANGFPTYL